MPDDTPLFAPQRRERRVTSLAGWRHSLPSTTPAAPAIPTTKPARRTVTVEQLLAWAYRDQKVHRYLRTEMDWFLLGLESAESVLSNPKDRRPVHPDAALVHAVVMGEVRSLRRQVGALKRERKHQAANAALSSLQKAEERAQIVCSFAASGDGPERITTMPRPQPVEPPSRADDYGWFIGAEGERRDYWVRTKETVSYQEQEWEIVGRKKVRRGKARWVRFDVKYCPVAWSPDPELIVMCDAIADKWEAAVASVQRALCDVELRDHVLTS